MTNVTYVFSSIVSVMWVLIDDQSCSSIMTSLGIIDALCRALGALVKEQR